MFLSSSTNAILDIEVSLLLSVLPGFYRISFDFRPVRQLEMRITGLSTLQKTEKVVIIG
jgi:hypothetical protein